MTGSGCCAAILLLLTAATPVAAPQETTSKPPGASGKAQPDAGFTRETLEYAIEWRLIPAGAAKFVWGPLPNAGPQASEIKLHLESTGLVSRLFRVNDDYTAVLGQNFCAMSSFMQTREGSRNRETQITFDQQAHKAVYTEKDFVKNLTTTHEEEIPACVHDVVGGLMVLRTLRLEPGKTVQIPITDGKKVAQVKIESQRREDIATPSGVRKTIRYEIFLFDNVLYKRSAHLHIWMTDDNMRLPVQLQVHLQFAIGTITFRLEKQERS